MKLITFTKDHLTGVGAIEGSLVYHLNAILDEPQLTMLDLVQRGLEALPSIQKLIDATPSNADANNVFDLSAVTILAPLSNPGKVICVGNNYMDHCREQNVEPPKNPMIFSKWPSCIVGPGEPIILPKASEQVDYEAELGVVMGKGGKHIAKESVLDCVYGYTIVNDISARDVQFADGQWVRGKSFDTFAPCGPYLVTADEIADPHQLDIRLEVNGNVLQDSNTKEMIFDIVDVVSYLSKGFTFEKGDLLATGTPHGVGVFRDPQIFLRNGDTVKIEIEGLGTLVNHCVAE